MLPNNFTGKKKLVSALSDIYCECYNDIASIELKKYTNGEHEEEFVLLTWTNGAISTANNNMNSLSATARNVAGMLDGGVYQNLELYEQIMNSNEWNEVI